MKVAAMVGAALVILMGSGQLSGGQSAGADSPATPFFGQHCIDCHGPDVQKGGLRLDAFTLEGADEAVVERAVRVFDRVRKSEMPPKKSAALPEADRAAFLTAFGGELDKADRKLAVLKRPALRRMNRVEYEETLRDLLALPALQVKDELPEDGRRNGFDKVAGALDLSHIQISKYLSIADRALRQAVATQSEAPERKLWHEAATRQDSARLAIRTINAVPLKGHDLAAGYATKVEGDPVKDPGNSYRVGTFEGDADSLAIFSGPLGAHQPMGIQPDRFRPSVRGWYRVRFSAWGLRWKRTTAFIAVRGERRILSDEDKEPKPPVPGDREVLTHVVRASLAGKPLEYFDVPSLTPTIHEFRVWLEPRQVVSFHAMTLPAYGPANWASKDGPRHYEGPGVAFDWFEVEGPILEQWPPESHRRLFGAGPVEKVDPREALRGFAERAFRRPVDSPEVGRYLTLVEDLSRRGLRADDALLGGYKAILCAPEFLFVGLEGGPGAVLASRLSYFLWNSLPDDELLARARAGDLSRPDVLHAQVERMLRDPKSSRFVEHFLDEWLEMRNIDFTTPDRQLYPEFDPWLRDSMLEETRATFARMLEQDRGVVNLVSSEDVLVNQRLADLYRIPGVAGAKLRPVPLTGDAPRGGFLTQGAVLKVTANGTATSPVLRGVWISERILGVPRLPPPPNVSAIEPDAHGAVTIRQILEKHRADPACASCHAKTDPSGFALESFDAIGAWRDRYRASDEHGKPRQGLKVDSAGTLPDGREFEDIRGLRRLLAADPEALARNLVRQLLVYATGTGLRFSDRPEIEAILTRSRARNFGLRSLVQEVVASRFFQETKGGTPR